MGDAYRMRHRVLSAGTVLQTFEGHRGAVTAVTVLPDGQRGLSGSTDSTLKLRSRATAPG